MPVLYIKADCDLEMTPEEGYELDEPVTSISDITFAYVGFTDVAHKYEIIADESDTETLDISFENISNNKIKLNVKGVVKLNVKADLHHNLFNDSNPELTLKHVMTNPFSQMNSSDADKTNNRCEAFQKKPK